jgi:hypothetical protein
LGVVTTQMMPDGSLVATLPKGGESTEGEA